MYGDIGTSPLYVYQAIKKAAGKINETVALGSLSLVFWTLIIIVAVKYCMFVMRADNRGEGGIFRLDVTDACKLAWPPPIPSLGRLGGRGFALR